MNSLKIAFACLLFSTFSLAQNSTQWPDVMSPTINLNNTTSAGYVGLGIRPNSSSTLLPSYNFHLHGSTDFTLVIDDAQTGMIPTNSPYFLSENLPETSISIAYGKTTRLGLTNTTTGLTNTDGGVIQMSELDMYIANREFGNMTLAVPGISMRFISSTKRIFIGNVSGSSPILASYNLQTNADNGLYVKTNTLGKYGIALNVRGTTDAIQVLDADDSNKKNFKVSGTGEVFARKYTTTLVNIPDYVFAEDYALMSFAELRTFVQNEKHLPNVPSAKEYETNGVELGEMNRILLEKVEELTLYILQLEERMKKVEAEE